MIVIRQPQVRLQDGQARLSSEIRIDDKTYLLWYSVDARFGEGLCYERSDAFLVGLLHYALVGHHDITCEAPVTERLLRQIRESFIPAVCNENPKTITSIRIDAQGAPALTEGSAVGASVTCGVDSMYTLCCHEHEITHLLINKFHGETKAKSKEQLFFDLVEEAERVSTEGGYILVVGNTNYDGEAIPGLVFDHHVTYANAFAVYALQKLFSRYYLATTYDLGAFFLDAFVAQDCAHYDLLSVYCFSSDGVDLVSDGQVTRLNKLRRLVNWPMAQKYLDVCWNGRGQGKKNGTYDCPKCMRTVLEMLAIEGDEGVKRFSATFDVPYILSHKEEYLAELIRGKLQHDTFALESWSFRFKMGFKLRHYVSALLIVGKKIIKKAFRLGRTSDFFSPRG